MYITKYGLQWDDAEFTPLRIELECIRHRHSVEKGGLGYDGHLKEAMKLLWPHKYLGEIQPGYPRMRAITEKIVWAWTKYKYLHIIGPASAAKTHDVAHLIWLEYLSNPRETIATVTSTHLTGLRTRIFSEIISANDQNVHGIKLYYKSNPTPVLLNPEKKDEEKYMIRGIPTDKGETAVGKIQGNHSVNRHFVVVDEAQETPEAIWGVPANLKIDPDFRLVSLANIRDKNTEYGKWVEPVAGWESVNPDRDFFWETKVGYDPKTGRSIGCVIRIDAMQSPNIVEGRVIYPYLTKPNDVDEIINTYGKNSMRYWCFLRGFPPPDGVTGYIFSQQIISRMARPVEFTNKPIRIAAFDPSFEGEDDPAFSVFEYGATADKPLEIKVVDTLILPKSASEDNPLDFSLAQQAINKCREYGVSPENFIIDCTGRGGGVASIIRREWSGDILLCDYNAGATERPVRRGEKPANELYHLFKTELWFAGCEYAVNGLIGGVDRTKHYMLIEQLLSRRYENTRGTLVEAESKRDMKKRTEKSPDIADTLMMAAELLRRRGVMIGEKPADEVTQLKEMIREHALKQVEEETFNNPEFDSEEDEEYLL